jgi:hypothetical protein
MRGLDFVSPIDVEDPKLGGQDLRLTVDAYNWNPIHYATAYKRFKVLDVFKKIYGNQIDLIWAMMLPIESECEGVPSEQRGEKHGISQFLDESH